MCGILASINNAIQLPILAKALESLKHRGPDAQGQWLSECGKTWLGHRRLSIVDLSEKGTQPLSNEDKTVQLICNGEIYNYPVLRSRLEGLGHVFSSNSDSEVIVHAYETWGDQCLDRLEGMFAFVLWDETKKRFLAARDRLGIKPLYFHLTRNGVILASELQALLPVMQVPPQLEPLALAYYMTLGYIPSPWSIWSNISKLEPGHFLTWQDTQGICVKRYWEPPCYVDESLTFDTGEWEELFHQVLSEHLLADVPIGLFLSGGLDSSSIAAGLKELHFNSRSMTVSFPGSVHDEAPIAGDVAKHLGFSHKEIPLTLPSVNTLLEETITAFDEPQGYSALLSMNLVCKSAATEFKVVLAGDGGDEIFGGYNWYRNLNPKYPSNAKQWINTILGRKNRYEWSNFAAKSSLHQHASRLYPRFFPKETEALLAPTEISFSDEEMLAPLRKHYEPKLPLQRALQRIDLMTFCSDSILAKVDRASMAHSLEVRVPFLDHRIVEWGLIRSLDQREDVEGKPILRDYLKKRVPQSVLNHPKQGFSLRVLDNFDWDGALDTIQQGKLVKERYLSSKWKTYLQPDVPYREGRIWNLLILTHWVKAWLHR